MDNKSYHKNYRSIHGARISIIKKRWYSIHQDEATRKKREYFQTPKGRYATYKRGAKRRNIKFDLSFEEFILLWQENCFYCGDPIPTIGIDRIDNTEGYNKNNIVPCCPTCNYTKGDRTFDEFIQFCLKIAHMWSK